MWPLSVMVGIFWLILGSLASTLVPKVPKWLRITIMSSGILGFIVALIPQIISKIKNQSKD